MGPECLLLKMLNRICDLTPGFMKGHQRMHTSTLFRFEEGFLQNIAFFLTTIRLLLHTSNAPSNLETLNKHDFVGGVQRVKM